MKKYVFVLMLMTLWATTAHADSRHFGYSYEADSVLEKGMSEFEQWVTLRDGKNSGNFSRWDIREEIEHGFTTRVTSALYLNFVATHSQGVSGTADTDGMEFDGISNEWKYMALSPNLHPLGLLLYLEPAYSGKELEIETKVALQHNFGDNWIWIANATAEPQFEFQPGKNGKVLALEFSTGLAYKISPHWSTGLEVRNVNTYEDFKNHSTSALFVGPNVHYDWSNGWATLVFLPQLPCENGNRTFADQEALDVRLMAGFTFGNPKKSY